MGNAVGIKNGTNNASGTNNKIDRNEAYSSIAVVSPRGHKISNNHDNISNDSSPNTNSQLPHHQLSHFQKIMEKFEYKLDSIEESMQALSRGGASAAVSGSTSEKGFHNEASTAVAGGDKSRPNWRNSVGSDPSQDLLSNDSLANNNNKELDSSLGDTESMISQFSNHVTVQHLIKWLEETKKKLIHLDPSLEQSRQIQQLDMVVEFIKNSKSKKNNFDSLLATEEDEEMKQFLSEEFNPNAATSWTPKISLNAVANAIRFSKRLSKSTLKPRTHIYDIPLALHTYMDKIQDFDFDVFQFQRDCPNPEHVLYYMATIVFRHFRLVEIFNCSMDKLRACLMKANNSYHDNPYHNALHAADVLQTTTFLLSSQKTRSYLSDLDILAMVCAVIFHDVDHPGCNNAFEQKVQSERALLYNDTSILENHHATTCFKILYKEEFNFLSSLNKNQSVYLRRVIIALILGTDIALHFSTLDKLKENLLGGQFNGSDEEHVILLMKMIVKCADINNPTKPLHLSRQWANRVTEEFFQQGDREKSLKLPVSAFSDRENANLPKSQIGFIRFIAHPLYSVLVEFDQSYLTCLETMEQNKQYWTTKMEELEGKSSTGEKD